MERCLRGVNLPLRKWFYAICLFLSCKKGISSCLLAKEIHVISYYWGESAQRLNRHYRRPECLWHLYMRITDTRLSRTAGISIDGLPLELDRGILESYQTRHKKHLLPCWRVISKFKRTRKSNHAHVWLDFFMLITYICRTLFLNLFGSLRIVSDFFG